MANCAQGICRQSRLGRGNEGFVAGFSRNKLMVPGCLLALMAAAGVRGPDLPVAQANTSTATSISTANSGTPVILVSDSVTARPALVTRGAATLWTPSGSAPMQSGDVAFVPAGEEHRFVDIVEDYRTGVLIECGE